MPARPNDTRPHPECPGRSRAGYFLPGGRDWELLEPGCHPDETPHLRRGYKKSRTWYRPCRYCGRNFMALLRRQRFCRMKCKKAWARAKLKAFKLGTDIKELLPTNDKET